MENRGTLPSTCWNPDVWFSIPKTISNQFHAVNPNMNSGRPPQTFHKPHFLWGDWFLGVPWLPHGSHMVPKWFPHGYHMVTWKLPWSQTMQRHRFCPWVWVEPRHPPLFGCCWARSQPTGGRDAKSTHRMVPTGASLWLMVVKWWWNGGLMVVTL